MKRGLPALFATIVVAVLVFAAVSPAVAQDDEGGGGGGPSAAQVEALKKRPTPRMQDGHPDLSGYWGGGYGFVVAKGKRSEDGKTYDIDNPVGTAERPSRVAAAAAARAARPPVPPPYKPEFAAKAKEMSDHFMKADPVFTSCALSGFPRVGTPAEIFQSADSFVFIYNPIQQYNSLRVIPTDNRKHDPILNPSLMGESVGHWEGDTLVVDVINFVDNTWISRTMPIHSDQMHIVEKLTRVGDTIQWQATIEDPQVFTKPVVQNRTMTLGQKGHHILEEAPCIEQDAQHIPDK